MGLSISYDRVMELEEWIASSLCEKFEEEGVVVPTCLPGTDVIVTPVGKYHDLIKLKPSAEIWVAFGSGRNFCFDSINSICASLGEKRSRALPVFHAFTGSDQTSAFYGKGKKSTWQAWQAYEEVTETFVYLAQHPFEKLTSGSHHFQKLKRFTVILYDRTSPHSSINQTRKELFCHRNCAMDKLPPTQVC